MLNTCNIIFSVGFKRYENPALGPRGSAVSGSSVSLFHAQHLSSSLSRSAVTLARSHHHRYTGVDEQCSNMAVNLSKNRLALLTAYQDVINETFSTDW